MDQKLDTLLRKHNLSVTAARKAVLNAVMKFPHSDADTLYKHARKISGTLSKQAVYDNLRTLAEKGIVRTIQPMGHSALFEIDHQDNHHHIVCRSCGMTTDVHCKHGAAPCLTPAESMGFVLDEAEVVFWGICPGCQTKTSRKKGR
ncbi:MAG: transcriptional repressor [Alphaproteobacteria bacterium]|nr:transcriptional repressor [Alphaproteobacteria bacterium]